ncbi:MAG: ATP synthase F1 subunit gamma [Breznakibacter sp.]|nr:ATP synthase F1 subunit gamma [Breznakibacter sp.]
MANLKDIRTRINSVRTTRQVTSAMKMVSAARLKKAQDDISNIRPYVSKVSELLANLVGTMEGSDEIDFAAKREVRKVLLVVITSNRGLCGAFNSNVVKEAVKNIKGKYRKDQVEVELVAFGKLGQKLLKSNGFIVGAEYNEMLKDLKFAEVAEVANGIMDRFLGGELDQVYLVYNEFVNAATQNVIYEQFLPILLPNSADSNVNLDYIFEPDKLTIVKQLVPNALRTIFWKSLLDSVAAEHGARMTSMHKATDNATELLGELQLTYNKARQANITNEILEIVGGAEALKK